MNFIQDFIVGLKRKRKSLIYTCLLFGKPHMPRLSRFHEFLPKLRQYIFEHHSVPTFQELTNVL